MRESRSTDVWRVSRDFNAKLQASIEEYPDRYDTFVLRLLRGDRLPYEGETKERFEQLRLAYFANLSSPRQIYIIYHDKPGLAFLQDLSNLRISQTFFFPLLSYLFSTPSTIYALPSSCNRNELCSTNIILSYLVYLEISFDKTDDINGNIQIREFHSRLIYPYSKIKMLRWKMYSSKKGTDLWNIFLPERIANVFRRAIQWLLFARNVRT